MRPKSICKNVSRRLAGLFAVFLMFQCSALAAAPGDLPAQMRLRRHVIADSSANNMTAMTVFLPEGWQFEGKVFWDLQSFIHPARVMFQARGPQDGAEILFFPMMVFSFGNPPPAPVGQRFAGVIVKPPMKSEALLRELFPGLRPQAAGLKIISVERPKDVEVMMRMEVDKMRAGARARQPPNQASVAFDYDLALMTVTYTENGRCFTERLLRKH